MLIFDEGKTLSSAALTAVIPLRGIDESTVGLKDTILKAVQTGIKVILIINNIAQSERDESKKVFTDIASKNFSIIESQLQSPGEARNLGIQACSTAYITFWDADDYPIVSEVCELIKKLSINPTMNYGLGGFEIINTKNVVLSRHVISESQPFEKQIVRNPGIWRWIFRTQKIRNTKFQFFSMGEDQDFISDINPNSSEMIFSDAVTYRYVRGWNNQLTGNQKAIDEIALSIKYLFAKVMNKKANHWHKKFLFRQLLTGVKRGSWRTKVFSVRCLMRLILTH